MEDGVWEMGYNRTAVAAAGGQDGWVCLEAATMYVACIYWAITTITSIG